MSIGLDIESYCENCPHFEPEAVTNTLFGNHPSKGIVRINETVVTCVHRRKCENIYDHIKEEERKKNEERN